MITIGNFDGLHKGHNHLIDITRTLSREKGLKSLLITFNPHPVEIFNNDSFEDYLITSLDKKINLLNYYNLDYLYIIDFNQAFADMDPKYFIIDFLYKKFNPSDIIIGYDHFFGKNREGSFDLLNKYSNSLDYKVHRIEKVMFGDLDIKSNIIRNLIKNGQITEANSLLGRDFSFYGKVIHGEGLGKKLSFPTANIEINHKIQLLPKNGVYSTEIFIKKNKKSYNSVCNIGVRPTFNDNVYVERRVEVHILSDKKFDIYDCEVELIFKRRIRDEIKFKTKEELINQINLDKEYCIQSIRIKG